MVTKKDCRDCPYSDNSINYSNWFYCNKPNDRFEFTIIRTASDWTGEKYKIKPPKWCPEKSNDK